MRIRLLALLVITILLSCSDLNGQEGFYPVTSFTTKDYGREFNPSNWSVVQDKCGIIYIANGFKLISYDGYRWSSCPINREAWILSLATDSSGIIYVGSQNEFGFFEPDRRSGLRYKSLSDSLKDSDRNFTNIWRVNITSAGVFFQAEEKMFLYSKGRVTAINPQTTFHTSFAVNDILYTRQREVGLTEWRNGKFEMTDGGDLFKSAGIFLMMPLKNNSNDILIGTREKGFWIYNRNMKPAFRAFPVSDSKLLEEALVTGGTLLGNGHIAISTLQAGIIIIDKTGKTVSVIDKRSGMADNDIKEIISDRHQDVWLAMNNGIGFIESSSPLSFFSGKSGIEGSVNSVLKYNGILYAGSTAGLFSRSESKDQSVRFSEAFNITTPTRSLVIAGSSLIAGTDAGIYEINGVSAVKRSNDNTFSQWYSPGLGLLFTGGSKGVTVFRLRKSFSIVPLPVEIKSDVIAVAGRENKTHDSCTVWIGTRYEGVIRIVSDKNLRFKIDRYNESDGLSSGPVMPFFYNDNVLLGSSDGFYRFVDEKSVKLSLPDSLKNNPDFLKGYFTGFKSLTDTLGKSISSFLDTPDRTWICADNNLAYVDKSNGSSLVLRPFLAIDAGKVTSIYPENDSITWFCTSEGLIRYNNNDRKNYDSPYEALIRDAVTIKNDSVLFKGRYYVPGGASGPHVIRYQPDFLKPVLPYRSNSLRFEFSATFFENRDKMLFSSYLEGNDAAWTGWEHKYYQEYTNLREGSYTFHVKAKNVFGKISSEASFSFTILPPWYRSLPALLVYIIASFFVVWLIVRLYSLRLKRENIRLEGIVMERTAEVVMQRDILEHQKKEIEDSIRYAGRIQNAVLPASSDFRKLAPDSFVFFRPRDIVSGDFYWIGRIGDKTIISVADCTGHGVPGAFMSMLGVAFLNEIVNKDKIHDPKIILDTLRDKVIEALQQQGISGEAKDGMDIVVICIDETEMKLQYSGAYNPLIMVKKGQLSEIQADKMPIAIYERMKGFTGHDVSIEKGDIFYFFSDGFEDQFGGPEGKKFKARRFKELLAGISGLPMNEQKEIIEKSFTEWKGDLNQVDDIVVVGVRI